MFFKLVTRNSRRSKKENGLFFLSLIIAVAAFYLILSLEQQDVMIFLKDMESDAVNRLMGMIPVFYGLTLFLLFFLIYYASKFQLDRRRHEFGVYLMMGMGRIKLFFMLLAEDMGTSLSALLIGLPTSIFCAELISLLTAKMTGIGIIGHQIQISLSAIVWTVIGFLVIKFAAFLLLSGKLAREEIGALLAETAEGTKEQRPTVVYVLAMAIGTGCLIAAYWLAISGIAWYKMGKMALTVCFGLVGTLCFFYGLRFPMGVLASRGQKKTGLAVFEFRQIQETVMHRSTSLAISSLLILAALCCFGAGVGMAQYYGQSETHVLDYSFLTEAQDIKEIRKTLDEAGLTESFSSLFEMQVGYIRTREDDYEHALQIDSVIEQVENLEESEDKDSLLNTLEYATYPQVIALSSYNQLLEAAGKPQLTLGAEEAAVYMDHEFTDEGKNQILEKIFQTRPQVLIDDMPYYLTGTVQTIGVVTDRALTLSFALILPDEDFVYFTEGDCDNRYLNAVLSPELTKKGLTQAIMQMNEKLKKTGLSYESYLQNMGRQLFYVVADCYLTIYLAIIFMIIANTIIGVQFLMEQHKSSRRYKTLIRLGATYEVLCATSKRQISWYFGIPIGVAAASSLMGVRALYTGLLPSTTMQSIPEMLLVSCAMILLLLVVEYGYITAVKRISSRYLLTLMVPEREE